MLWHAHGAGYTLWGINGTHTEQRYTQKTQTLHAILHTQTKVYTQLGHCALPGYTLWGIYRTHTEQGYTQTTQILHAILHTQTKVYTHLVHILGYTLWGICRSVRMMSKASAPPRRCSSSMACCPSTTVVTSLYPVLSKIPSATCKAIGYSAIKSFLSLRCAVQRQQGLCVCSVTCSLLVFVVTVNNSTFYQRSLHVHTPHAHQGSLETL